MTRKEVHNILDQPRRLAVKIKRLTEEREALIAVLMPGGMSMDDRIQKTPEDLMAKIMAEVADIDEEIAQLQDRRVSEIIHLRHLLEGDDARMLVVSMSYLGGRPIREIAEELHYALKYIYQLRGEGLDEIGKVLEETE